MSNLFVGGVFWQTSIIGLIPKFLKIKSLIGLKGRLVEKYGI